MMTKKQKREIYLASGLAVWFQKSFDREWHDATERLMESRYDLGKIVLVPEGGGKGHGL